MHRLGSQNLRENELDCGTNAKLVRTPTHIAAMLSVLTDQADIAIIAAPFFDRVDADVRENIGVIARTALALHHPISVGEAVPEDFADRLKAALLALPETPEGLGALEELSFPGFATPEPGLYEAMDWAADEIERLLGFKSK